MLLDVGRSAVLLVDVQEKLAPAIWQIEAVIERCQWAIELALALAVPILVSEQYPQGLGNTVAALRPWIEGLPTFHKHSFSCLQDDNIKVALEKLNKQHIVLIGIEAHVCVLQTALDLLGLGHEVYIVVNAVSSRHELDYAYGLRRMQQAGAQLVTAEMLFFEWLKKAEGPEYKALSLHFLKRQRPLETWPLVY